MNCLTNKFIPTDTSLAKVSLAELEVGNQYYLEEIVIPYHCLYDYQVKVTAKTDEYIEVMPLFVRQSDNCVYPGDWASSEGNIMRFTCSEVMKGVHNEDIMFGFYMDN
jgi:hypothetical protein